MKKKLAQYMIYCILGSFILAFVFCYISVKDNNQIFENLAVISLVIGPILCAFLFFLNIIVIIIDGMKKVRNFKGNELFVEIDRFRTYSKNNSNYYVEMVSIVNRAYDSKTFKKILKEKSILDLLERKKYLEKNLDLYNTPIMFIDTILYFLFTTLLGFMMKYLNANGWLILGTLVLLFTLEVFILFYKYSDLIALSNSEYEIYKYELDLIENSIRKINKTKCNKKQYQMYQLKMVIYNKLTELRRETIFFKKKSINNDIDRIKELNICDNLESKYDYIIIEISGKKYRLYYLAKEVEASESNIVNSEVDVITDIIVNVVNRNKIGEIKRK